jgi:hypothetical protein
MLKTAILVAIGILIIGTSSFSKDKSSIGIDSNSTILGMILLEEPNSMKIKNVISNLRNEWDLNIDDKESSDSVSVLRIDGYRVVIVNMPYPIPGDEITTFAEYNYFWKNGTAEASKHKGHIILSIMNTGKNLIQENFIFNKVAASILKNSKSLGIYIGNRNLLLKKEFYLKNTDMMTDENLPLYNWIYFGLRKSNGKLSIYTFGLADFNKNEMEIVESDKSLKELTEMMYDLVHYVIISDVTLKDGETVGLSANQKLKVTESKGVYVEGTTFKIEY